MKNQDDKIKISKGSFVNFKKGMIENDYVIGEECGSGAFATVRKVKSKSTGQVRALKIIKKTKSQDSARMYLEVEILKKLIHPNIMQIFEFYEDKKNFYIITEICDGGELFEQIVNKGAFNETECANVIKQILSAVNYIHLNSIVHRDLKPENILLDTNKNDVIKIIDWGTARFFEKNKKMNKVSGTPYYIAPEVLFEKYDEKCDVWSIGIIMYILLCGYPPFNGDSDTEILNRIKEGKFTFPKEEWENVSNDAKDLINCMLKYNPEERLSASDCLQHKWLTGQVQKKIDTKLSTRCLDNMKKFHAERKLQQAALTFIVNHLLSKEEKNELMELFQSLDTNGDGVLNKEELYEGYKQQMDEDDALKEVERIMSEIDIDKSGTIDYNEFLIAATNRQKVLNKDKLEQTFKMFDKDGNGSISLDEIRSILGNSFTDQKVLESIVKECDTNGDGEISMSEFKEMMNKIIN
jgi:calcium-dependent protein kinase